MLGGTIVDPWHNIHNGYIAAVGTLHNLVRVTTKNSFKSWFALRLLNFTLTIIFEHRWTH